MYNQKTVDLYQFILENKESLKKDVEYKLELNYLTDPWLKRQIEYQVFLSRREHLIRSIFLQTDYTYEEVMIIACDGEVYNIITEILEG